MTSTEIQQILIRSIQRAGESFVEGELAFLSLTSKIERQFLDRVAFATHQAIGSSETCVAREYALRSSCRADLAVVEKQRVTVVEAKAMLSAGWTQKDPNSRAYLKLLQKDLDRYNAMFDSPQIYCLLLAVHPLSLVPVTKPRIVKYPKRINQAFKRLGSARQIRRCADDIVTKYVRDTHRAGSGRIPGGEAFGTSVELLWWLFGPFRAPSDLQLLHEE